MSSDGQSGAWFAVLSTERRDGTLYVIAVGEIDTGNQRPLEDALYAAVIGGHDRVDLDVGLVTFIDAAVVATLVRTRELAVERGCVFRVLRPTGLVARVLSLTSTGYLLCAAEYPVTVRHPCLPPATT